jgi:hypothetical protein
MWLLLVCGGREGCPPSSTMATPTDLDAETMLAYWRDMHPPSSTTTTVLDMCAVIFSSAREHKQLGGADQLRVGGSGVAARESCVMHL